MMVVVDRSWRNGLEPATMALAVAFEIVPRLILWDLPNKRIGERAGDQRNGALEVEGQ